MAFLLVSYSHLNVFDIPKHVKITVFSTFYISTFNDLDFDLYS